jgi:hypothetical protein
MSKPKTYFKQVPLESLKKILEGEPLKKTTEQSRASLAKSREEDHSRAGGLGKKG